MDILACAKVAHLLGLVMGLGGAMLADFTVLTRGVIRPVCAYTLHQMQLLSRIVALGLALLWASGIAIIAISVAANPDYLTNQKLWAKIVIVAVLTLNGVYIHARVLPALKGQQGRRLFDGTPDYAVALMALCGGVSAVSWFTPLLLAKATALNYVTPVQNILGVYAMLLMGAWLGAFAAASAIRLVQTCAREGYAP